MARQLQARAAIQRDIRCHSDLMPRQQVHRQRPPGALQQVGGKREHGRSLRVFPQQLTVPGQLLIRQVCRCVAGQACLGEAAEVRYRADGLKI